MLGGQSRREGDTGGRGNGNGKIVSYRFVNSLWIVTGPDPNGEYGKERRGFYIYLLCLRQGW